MKTLSLLVLLLLLSSCSTYRYIYFDLKEAPKVDKIFLVSVDYQNNSDESNQIFFPSSDFMLEPFLDGLLHEFNSNDYGAQITTWDDLDQTDSKMNKLVNLASSNQQSVLNYKKSLLIRNLNTWKKIKPYHQIVNADYYLSLILNFSPQEQTVTGEFRLRSTKQGGRVIWREQLLHHSPYIENDPESPYISKSQRVEYPPADQDSTHYLELVKSFKQLGEEVGKSLKDTLSEIKDI